MKGLWLMPCFSTSLGRQKHVLLVGPSGVGKSALAPILAEYLDIDWCDTDEVIDSESGATGAWWLQHHGLSVFRSIEAKIVVKALSNERPQVIATGAGAWTIDDVRSLCSTVGTSVWLDSSVEDLVNRVRGSNRYITTVRAPEVVIAEQLRTRIHLYRKADIHVDCRGLNLVETAECVIGHLALRKPR